jgi:hypothetical protein
MLLLTDQGLMVRAPDRDYFRRVSETKKLGGNYEDIYDNC